MRTDLYTSSLINYNRFSTSEVVIGNVKLGHSHTMLFQSMTNTATSDIKNTVQQIIAIHNAGAQMVRITVPAIADVVHFKTIKDYLKQVGLQIPLVADVHFNAKIAEQLVGIADKIRINPGNYSDYKTYAVTPEAYEAETEKIRQNFVPLLKLCQQTNTAIRIGTNHGSLSNRILHKYGDTPEGITEATLEFLRIAKQEDFKNLVISLKASNPFIVVQATRLLVAKMKAENILYPIHLGVTEAGEGADGRIKSAVGIGALLADGIGDTIRVSLTEDPELEIPVAQKIVRVINNIQNHEKLPEIPVQFYNPYIFNKHISKVVTNIGGTHKAIVIADISATNNNPEQIYEQLKNENPDRIPDFFFTHDPGKIDHQLPEIKFITPANHYTGQPNTYPLFTLKSYVADALKNSELNFIEIDEKSRIPDTLNTDNTIIWVLQTANLNPIGAFRSILYNLWNKNCNHPVVLQLNNKYRDFEMLAVEAGIHSGGIYIDGFGNGLFIKNTEPDISVIQINNLMFNVLQACRLRITQTDYISCPGCGRTLFDLQTTTKKVKEATMQYKHLKIAIMGCIVNGPGEMADADYGYVGTGYGKITLYKHKDIVKRNIDEKDAVNELVNLIRNEEQKNF